MKTKGKLISYRDYRKSFHNVLDKVLNKDVALYAHVVAKTI